MKNDIFVRNFFRAVEDWQLDFEWLRVQHYVKDVLGKKDLPDLNVILFLIGIQELGRIEQTFTKEEKQDLMHIAICALLSKEGYFTFHGLDEDGWPHYVQTRHLTLEGAKAQEGFLKEKIIGYFAEQGVLNEHE